MTRTRMRTSSVQGTLCGLASLVCVCACSQNAEKPALLDAGRTDGPSPVPKRDAGGGGKSGDAARDAASDTERGPADSGHDRSFPDASDGGRNLGTDMSLFFGASRCEAAGVLLCDGFETGTLDTTTWTVNGTAPVIDGVHAARGQKALHITQSGNGQSSIEESKTFPVPNDTYFGRVFVWFEKLPFPSKDAGTDAAFTYSHWTMVAASGTEVAGQIRVSGQLENGRNLFGVGTDNRVMEAGTGDWTLSDKDPAGNPSPVPTGEWLCIEWMHDGATNETQFYWSAVLHPSLSTSSTMHGGNANPFILPQFTNVWVGWQEYQPTTEPFEMWLDEVAIDTSRIGCID